MLLNEVCRNSHYGKNSHFFNTTPAALATLTLRARTIYTSRFCTQLHIVVFQTANQGLLPFEFLYSSHAFFYTNLY